MLWADWMDTVPRSSEYYVSTSGENIFDIAPPMSKFMKPEDLRRLEDKIYEMMSSFETANGKDLKDLYLNAIQLDCQDVNDPGNGSEPHDFTYYTIMRMLGHGISWSDDHVDPKYKYPHFEISYLEFPRTFPRIEETEDDEIEDWEKEGEDWKGDDSNSNSSDDWKL